MKILLLVCLFKSRSGNSFGGAEKSIINLANWLSQNEHDVFLASVEGQEKSFDIDDAVNYLSFNWQPQNRLLTHIQIFRNTQKAIRIVKPDVIISFWIHPMLYSIINPRSWFAKIIYSERNDPKLEYSFLSRLFRFFVLIRSNHVVFQTKSAQDYFCKNIKRKSTVIHNPVYISKNQYRINKGDNRIVSVGRLSEQKNFSLLIKAFKTISNLYPELILEIYGEGPLKKDLTELIKELDVVDKVFLMGAHKDVLDRIYGAKMFVLPSHYEGMPNALMEAMAIGIPAISSDCPCGGPKELIQDGENGFLFECESQKSLENTMIRVIELNEKEKARICENEKEICVNHSQELIFKQWMRLIRGTV